jgi:hypothetical protein
LVTDLVRDLTDGGKMEDGRGNRKKLAITN